jgi:hypothetical protein
MQAPKIYRVTISDLESIFGMSAAPLNIEGSTDKSFVTLNDQIVRLRR